MSRCLEISSERNTTMKMGRRFKVVGKHYGRYACLLGIYLLLSIYSTLMATLIVPRRIEHKQPATEELSNYTAKFQIVLRFFKSCCCCVHQSRFHVSLAKRLAKKR